MSIVAYDGHSLAADRQATNGDLRFEARKLVQLMTGDVLAWTGDQSSAAALRRWYEEGAKREVWPASQQHGERWCRLIVAPAVSYGKRQVLYYEQEPEPILLLAPFMAWGSGRDFAMGALARGANAKEAVEIACRFCITCGMGVDVEYL